jgi:uncharacterized protein YceH (UPF0502 family)
LKTNVVAGNFELGSVEQRILGCLLEKQKTTPDGYPLSLNALRLACNQSTNREPVVEYDESTIRDGLHRLERRGLVRLASGAGSRAAKFRHLLAQALPMDDGEQALVCVLLLRGAQTPGELKQRAERMHAFTSVPEVQQTLDALIGRGLVARHARRPGQKEDRFSHLLGAEQEAAEPAASAGRGAPAAGGDASVTPQQLAALAERVARLERELAALRGELAPGGEPNGAASAAEAPSSAEPDAPGDAPAPVA